MCDFSPHGNLHTNATLVQLPCDKWSVLPQCFVGLVVLGDDIAEVLQVLNGGHPRF